MRLPRFVAFVIIALIIGTGIWALLELSPVQGDRAGAFTRLTSAWQVAALFLLATGGPALWLLRSMGLSRRPAVVLPAGIVCGLVIFVAMALIADTSLAEAFLSYDRLFIFGGAGLAAAALWLWLTGGRTRSMAPDQALRGEVD